jgi:hypothetical protein
MVVHNTWQEFVVVVVVGAVVVVVDNNNNLDHWDLPLRIYIVAVAAGNKMDRMDVNMGKHMVDMSEDWDLPYKRLPLSQLVQALISEHVDLPLLTEERDETFPGIAESWSYPGCQQIIPGMVDENSL